MKRPAICFCLSLCVVGWAGVGFAKGKAAAPKAAEAAPEAAPAEAAPAADPNAAAADPNAAPADPNAPAGEAPTDQTPISPDVDLNAPLPTEPGKAKAATTLSWQDIVVVPRKAFLKGGRLELAPFSGMSINDNLIRHYGFGANINYFLSDVMWIGLEGQYFIKAYTPTEENVGLDYNRIPTLNKYLYGGGLNFGYAPVYGKFAWFNKQIMHWEIYGTGGVGITVSEIIPRDSRNAPWKNNLLTPEFSIGSRFFLFDWLTVNFALRDYILPDKYEARGRTSAMTVDVAKANADSKWVNNVMAYVGVGFFLPTKFTYKTPR
jgi:outer membrane beta-barrel protein